MANGGAAKAIDDAAALLRRIRPDQVVMDKNTGQWRPSSAAFKDPNLSVDAEPFLAEDGHDYHWSLKDYPGYSLVSFTAGHARSKQQSVAHTPIPDTNPYHAEVIGKKTPSTSNHLRDGSTWVHLIPPTVGS
ncbi:hypothetical protein [Methylorubrum extorquens]|uniref:hypothetical protein n=1 Tax=Methylorubrum extorquens TaxID=408 RepID=UPI001EE56433|nr:hypothetical protein [Methylorubrum extorquens]